MSQIFICYTHSTPHRPLQIPRLRLATRRGDLPPITVLRASHSERRARLFLRMMREHEEFEVETDVPGELPLSVCTETVRRVVVE